MINKKSSKIQQLVICAMLMALSIVFGKFLQIPIGNAIRISFEALPVILAGMVFGPIQGLIVGAAADVLGCFLRGYTLIPLITVAAGCVGLIAGLFTKVLKKRNYIFILLTELVSHITCSVIIKSVALWLAYGTPLEVLALRLPIYIGLSAAEAVIILALFKKKVISF